MYMGTLLLLGMYISVSTCCLWFIIGEIEIKYIHCCLTSYGKGRLIMLCLSEATTTMRAMRAAVVFWFEILFSSYVIHTYFFTYRIWIYIKKEKEGI